MIDCLYIVLPISFSHIYLPLTVLSLPSIVSPDTSHSIFLSITGIRLYMYYDSNVLGYRPIDSELVKGNYALYATYMLTVCLS